MMLFSMKMMGILEKILCLWMSPPWFRGSEGGHHIIHVSCTMVRSDSCKLSKDTSRENGGLDKHLGPIFFENFYFDED